LFYSKRGVFLKKDKKEAKGNKEDEKDKYKRSKLVKFLVLMIIYVIIGFLIYNNWDTINKKAVGFSLKNILKSPGGCSSQEECFNYCLEHQEECKRWCIENPRFCNPVDSVEIPEEGGPGGCKTEQECLGYCGKIENEEECKEFFGV